MLRVEGSGRDSMYAQNVLLSLTAWVFHGIPQTILGIYADVVRGAWTTVAPRTASGG